MWLLTGVIYLLAKYICRIVECGSFDANNTVEPRGSGKFGQPEFFRYCGVFRFFAGSLFKK